MPPAAPECYTHHSFPSELLRYGVWPSYRFPLRYRAVQESRCKRGSDVTYEASRVARCRPRRPRAGEPGTESLAQEGGQAVIAQVAQGGRAVRVARHHYQ